MQYPLYLHRDGAAGFRASFPDLPRAVARGHSFDELKRMAQEVVELMYDRSEQLIPAPTCSTSELQSLDMDDGQGIWIFIEINLMRVTSKAVSVQFSLPESLLQRTWKPRRRAIVLDALFFPWVFADGLHPTPRARQCPKPLRCAASSRLSGATPTACWRTSFSIAGVHHD
jgi:predicted RNase H-like HicB family nuclease